MNSNDFYLDEPCVVSFHIGEVGWLLQYWQGYLRYLKQEKYPDHKFLIFMDTGFHVFVQDFVSYTINLPNWFKKLNLETDCYEAPVNNDIAGSLTPPNVYSKLLKSFREMYNPEKAIEIFPPRGCNFWINKQPQIFAKYTCEKEEHICRLGKP